MYHREAEGNTASVTASGPGLINLIRTVVYDEITTES